MSCADSKPDDVFECNFCDTQFEADVADRQENGQVRCPQCGLSGAKRVPREEVNPFVITRASKFR